MKVFISHSFEDRPKFNEFSQLLNQKGIPFFQPLDMKGTRSLAEQLKEAINDCEVCIFVATHNSVKSSWCSAELGAFWGAGKDVIIYLADSSLKESQLPKQFQDHLQERDLFHVVDTVLELVKKETLSLPAEGFPHARQVHGYSGRWKVKSVFKRWRGRDIKAGESVVFNGETTLFLQEDGKGGSGIQTGVLSVKLGGGYRETRKIFNEIVNASLDENRVLTITVRVRRRDLMRSPEGIPPHDLGEDWLKDLEAAPSFEIELEPVSGKSNYLLGKHAFDPEKVPHQLAEEDWNYLDFDSAAFFWQLNQLY